MTLPPQPSPSGIEVTHEGDPLTLEWRVRFGGKRRKLMVGAWMVVLALGLAPWALRGPAGLYVVIALWTALTFRAGILGILKLMKASGDARLVLHPDSLIWVPGGGSVPQVFRKSEVVEIQKKSRETALIVDTEDWGSAPRGLPLRGLFAPGDAAWLSDVLERWLREPA